MKINLNNSARVFALSTAFLAFGLSGVRAGDNKTGPFLSADVGVSLVDDIDMSVSGISGKVTFDPGVRFSAGAGYNFGLSSSARLGLEFESGFIYNSFDKASALGLSVSVDGSFTQVPFLGDVVLTLEPSPKWVLYAGVGGGGVYGRMDIDSVGGIAVGGESDETDPAFQAMAGVCYRITDNSEIGIAYKFLDVFPEDIDSITTHSIGLVYTLHF